jgi:hypothetical protein
VSFHIEKDANTNKNEGEIFTSDKVLDAIDKRIYILDIVNQSKLFLIVVNLILKHDIIEIE